MYEEYPDFETAVNPGMTGDAVIGMYGWIVSLLYWGFVFYMVYKIAHRTGQSDTAWWAFVPILNTLLLISMAGKPLKFIWWLLVPIVNIFAFFVLWINVARNCDKSGVWGFFCMIPLVNIIPLFILATSTRPYVYHDYEDEPGAGPQGSPKNPAQVG